MRTSSTLVALLTVALGATPVTAQPAHAPDPARLRRINEALDRFVAERQIAGGVLRVQQHGRVIHERAVGWADREANRPMTPDAIFRIASQTKALTSIAIMMLVEEGRLALNEPVSRWIPGFATTRVATAAESGLTLAPLARPITIRDLLTHTAGISYGTDASVAALYAAKGLGPAAGFGWYTADKDEGTCTTMDRLATLPIVRQPGSAYVYGYNTDILGCVVERASGVPFDEFLARRIIGPLGMRDTKFYLSPADRARFTAVYRSDSAGKAERAPDGAKGQGHYVEGPRKAMAGGAGLLSTAADYARLLEMLRNNGALDGVRILSPRSVDLLRTNQVGTLYRADGSLGFGLAFETVERLGASGYKSVGTYGWGGAYGTHYFVDPREGLVVVWMTQLMPNATDVQERLVTLVYQALVAP